MTHVESKGHQELARLTIVTSGRPRRQCVRAAASRCSGLPVRAGGIWVLTKYADMKSTLLDWETSSLDGRQLVGVHYPLEQIAEMLADWARTRLQDRG